MRHFTDDGYNIDIESEEFYEGYKEPVTFRAVWNIISAILAILCGVVLLIIFIPKIAGFNAYPFLPDAANAVIGAAYSWIVSSPGLYIVLTFAVVLAIAVFLPDTVLKIRHKVRLRQLEERNADITE